MASLMKGRKMNDLIRDGTAKGYSLWLMPDQPKKHILTAPMRHWAQELEVPLFVPHCTLLGGIENQHADVLNRVHHLASKYLYQIQGELIALIARESFFQSLFATFRHPDEIVGLHRITATVFGQLAGNYQPHVSIIYGDHAIEMKKRVACELEPLLPIAFPMEQVAIVDTNGVADEWVIQNRFPLRRLT